LAENVFHLNISSKEVYKFLLLFEQAKKIEKEQILESFTEGCFAESWVLKSAEKYYNETYK
jgi:hypothetical protein